MSAKQSASQQKNADAKADTVPSQKVDQTPEPVPTSILEDKKPTSNDSLIEATNAKAGKVEQKFDKLAEKGDRIEGKIEILKMRQNWILRKLTPVEIDVSFLLPAPVKPIQVNTDSLQIKPIKVEKRSWWKRRF
ncbi:hypothetical protein ASG33_08090 [Dyadobacter sp. Leaf189]|nr:hypothetical protein ASG33_08090 [Dyadobacter sp. Leaf189]